MRRFTEEQKYKLKKSILKEARALFFLYGYKKTSIQDITEKVSIAQGSFYHFFSSKAELYFSILELEEQSMREQLLSLKMDKNEVPKQNVKRAIKHIVFAIKENRLLSELLLGDNLEQIVR